MASIAGDSTTPGGHMRQRSRYACVPCRQRKRKCDGKYPCSTCTGYGYDCQYNSVRGGQDSNAASNYKNAPSPQGTKLKSPDADLDESPPSAYFAPKTRPSLGRRGIGEEGTLLKEDRPSTNGFLIPCKGRFVGRHSAVCPKILRPRPVVSNSDETGCFSAVGGDESTVCVPSKSTFFCI
jgi:hypothetical protein